MVKFFMKRKSGDSIIEVLIAVAIFSAIAVAALGIMNQGLDNAQSSLETTIVRTEMDTQAERIRFLADSVISDPGDSTDANSNSSKWNAITMNALETNESKDISSYQAFINNYKIAPLTSCNNVINASYHAFALEDNLTAKMDLGSNSSAIPSIDTGGLFVVSVKSPKEDTGRNPDYYDFYINTCWNAPGANVPTKLSTTIRIQNPKYTNSEPAPVDTPGETHDPGDLKITYYWNTDGETPDIKTADETNWHTLVKNPADYDILNSSATYKIQKSENGTLHDLGSIKSSSSKNVIYEGRTYSSRPVYGDYVFIGWRRNDSIVTDLGYECSYDSSTAPYTCSWTDNDGKSSIDLYAVWQKNEEPPKYLYCIEYQKTTPRGVTSVSPMSINATCKEYTDNTSPHAVSVSNNKFSAGQNFVQHSWRTDSTTWNGSLNSNYYDSSKIVPFGGNYNVSTANPYNGNNANLVGVSNLDDYAAVYFTTLYPQWRVNIKVGEDEQECREGSRKWGNYSDASCTKKAGLFGGKYFWVSRCRDGLNCPLIMTMKYQKQEDDCGVGCTLYKYLDAYTYMGGNVSYYGDASISKGNKLYIKIEDRSDTDGGNAGLWKLGDNYNDRRIVKYSDNEYGSLVNINAASDIGDIYYSAYLPKSTAKQGLFSQVEKQFYVELDDKIELEYTLSGGQKYNRDIKPRYNNDIVENCWHIFKFKPSTGELFIENKVLNAAASNNCYSPTQNPWTQTIPF